MNISDIPQELYFVGVKALVQNAEGRYLLLQVNTATLRAYDGPAYWDLPGGRIDAGERVDEALAREVREEVGVTDICAGEQVGMTISPIRIPTDTRECGLVLAVYRCAMRSERQAIQLSDEHVAYERVDAQTVRDRLATKYGVDFVATWVL